MNHVVSLAMELNRAVVGLHRRSCTSFRSQGIVSWAPQVRDSSLLGVSRSGSKKKVVVVVRCIGGEETGVEKKKGPVLKKGSAVVVTEAPPMLKTAEPMPMMRPNHGLINVGDAGRIMDRRPKDTWAVRFAVGAYLIDRKYFEPLEL